MRRLALMAAVALACSACNLFEMEEKPYESVWWVKNATSRTLEITPPPYGGSAARERHTIAPGESVRLYSRSEYDDRPYLAMILILWRGRPDAKSSVFDVCDTDKNTLVSWVHDPQYDRAEYYLTGSPRLSGDGFFDEQRWTESSDREKKRTKRCEWTFEITESDIMSQPKP